MSKITKVLATTPLKKESILRELLLINQGAKFQWQLQESNPENDKGPETKLIAQYKLKNYPLTWRFLGDVASKAHTFKHHPTITNTYTKVDFIVTTHDAGNQVTTKDIDLVKSIQDVYNLHFTKPQKVAELKSFVHEISSQSSLSQASKMIEHLIAVEDEHKKKS